MNHDTRNESSNSNGWVDFIFDVFFIFASRLKDNTDDEDYW